jgi:hypothetical protein
VIVGVASAVCFGVWTTTPMLPADARRVARQATSGIVDEVRAEMSSTGRRNLLMARSWLIARTAGRTNDLVGGPLREEDSPGNWTVREAQGRIQFVTYDGDGRETATELSGGR